MKEDGHPIPAGVRQRARISHQGDPSLVSASRVDAEQMSEPDTPVLTMTSNDLFLITCSSDRRAETQQSGRIYEWNVEPAIAPETLVARSSMAAEQWYSIETEYGHLM